MVLIVMLVVVVVMVVVVVAVARLVRSSLKSQQIRRVDLCHLLECAPVMTTRIMITATTTVMLTVMIMIEKTRWEMMILPLLLIITKDFADLVNYNNYNDDNNVDNDNRSPRSTH